MPPASRVPPEGALPPRSAGPPRPARSKPLPGLDLGTEQRCEDVMGETRRLEATVGDSDRAGHRGFSGRGLEPPSKTEER